MRKFEEVLEKAKGIPTCKVAVAAAEDEHVLEAVLAAKKQGIAEAVLVGDKEKILALATQCGVAADDLTIVHEANPAKAALEAVRLVSSGEAQVVMKGLIPTADFLRAVLNKDVGLRQGKQVLSHVAVMEIPGREKLLFMSDGAMNMRPDLPQKVQILKNVVHVAHALGLEKPRVAALAAVEVVNPDMPETVDAAALTKMFERGQIKGCIVDGPLALDNALSEEAAHHKGIVSEVAGRADVLLVPEIICGNMLYKAATFLAQGAVAGVVVGAKAPIVMTSRADSSAAKLQSIALAVLAAQPQK